MGGITPKWLSARLRELEAEGIIERDSVEGRREVWYRLTQKGRDLAPVLESLAVWGIEYAMRPPLPGEPVFPEMVLQAAAVFLNRRRDNKPAGPLTWLFRFDGRAPVVLAFQKGRWESRQEEIAGADLTITATPEALVAFLNARGEGRARLLPTLSCDGPPAAQQAFREIMVQPQGAAAS